MASDPSETEDAFTLAHLLDQPSDATVAQLRSTVQEIKLLTGTELARRMRQSHAELVDAMIAKDFHEAAAQAGSIASYATALLGQALLLATGERLAVAVEELKAREEGARRGSGSGN